MQTQRLKFLGVVLLTMTVILSSQWFSDSLRRFDRPNDGPAAELQVLPGMNQDQLEGRWKQVKGEMKMKWGELTDNDWLHIEGSHEKFVGELLEQYGDRREAVRPMTEEWRELENIN
jgi:uncharacterized protein YjbJ (UPF0337 family)